MLRHATFSWTGRKTSERGKIANFIVQIRDALAERARSFGVCVTSSNRMPAIPPKRTCESLIEEIIALCRPEIDKNQVMLSTQLDTRPCESRRCDSDPASLGESRAECHSSDGRDILPTSVRSPFVQHPLTTRCRSTSSIAAPGLTPPMLSGSSSRSLPPNLTAWVSAFPSVVRLSRITMARFGPNQCPPVVP